MYPINIVDAKTLAFGNKYLQEFCYNMSRNEKYKNKKVYVISIIGAQSSAKSTLLNYLFRCRFETSAGRCTKGMYCNICELDDKVIMVIDTEGLLSTTARDSEFDNRVATFVMSVSDIVIINNKGELARQLKDLLHICMYVMQYIRTEEKKENFQPIRLMFTLRDQEMPKKGSNVQEQMLANILESFEESKEKSSIDYKKYLRIETEDIFSCPSAISTQDKLKIRNLGDVKIFTESFGDCIKGLRSRLSTILKDCKGRESVLDCYKESQFCWETILNCGKNLMNFKTTYELQVK